MRHNGLLCLFLVIILVSCRDVVTTLDNDGKGTKKINQIIGTWEYNCPVNFIGELYTFSPTECTYLLKNDFPLHPGEQPNNPETVYQEWSIHNDTLQLRGNSPSQVTRQKSEKNKQFLISFKNANTLVLSELSSNRQHFKEFRRIQK